MSKTADVEQPPTSKWCVEGGKPCCFHEVERKHWGADGTFLPADIREKVYGDGRSDVRWCCICGSVWWLVWSRMR